MSKTNLSQDRIRIAVDRGGTFTDCIGTTGGGETPEQSVVVKLLSEDPANYKDAPEEGIRRILAKFSGQEIPRGEPLDTSQIESIRMGTTVATNALLERKGEIFALAVTKGFADCLEIGNQSRPAIFDLAIQKPTVLYDKVIEIDERVTLEDYAEDPDQEHLADPDTRADRQALVRGTSSELVRVLHHPVEEKVRIQLQELLDQGYRNLAICLLHGYTYTDHEALVGRIAQELGFQHISLSHSLMPMIKLVPRATSTCVDAYLTPPVKRYIDGFQASFEGKLGVESLQEARSRPVTRCEFMQSDGGLIDVDMFSGLKAILSGPAAGVVGYALTSYDPRTDIPVIGFDMGGTSTDVSRYGAGHYEHVFESSVAGITIQSPQLDINTVAAGGGSCLFFRNNLFAVGPASAGAHPGPACYRKGGPLTITDANLQLGRLLPEFFPKIFGEKEDEALDEDASHAAFDKLTKEINSSLMRHDPSTSAMTVDEVAYGFIKVANESMTRPIRSLTEAKGHHASKHRLATFGGAGAQHAAAIAENLGINQILIHRYSSVLSAYGLLLADVVVECQAPEAKKWSEESGTIDALQSTFHRLCESAKEKLNAQGFEEDDIVYEEYLNMRYEGSESALMVMRPPSSTTSNHIDQRDCSFGAAFVRQHEQEFGFTFPDRDIRIDDVRVRCIGKGRNGMKSTVDDQLLKVKRRKIDKSKQHRVTKVYFENGRLDTPIYRLPDLAVGEEIDGPTMIADDTQTILVPPRSSATILETHIVIDIGKSDEEKARKPSISTERPDPIMLSVFGHRFMAIAEQMGRALQKTSVSTNVKERLDYSCAIFADNGSLIANAPHLPVHLGSMATCVTKQAEIWQGRLKKGDVIISNHPDFGGTHLPDMTVITPAFNDDKIIFYVASRAHHADIGGILPGSMPPHSRELHQEGAAIASEKLVSEGTFNEARMIELLLHEPARFAGCSGTRCLADNMNDLKAQIAANQKGIRLINSLILEFTESVVQFYMRCIQDNAELSVRNLLKSVSSRLKDEGQIGVLRAKDYMDDGSPIELKIEIDEVKGEAIFDFAGTGNEVYGNINAPEAVTYSAIIYCLRSMIKEDIPLNQGCLHPIKVLIPKGSFLSPSAGAAVVGGNVLTSQRVTDVILRCFNACAASQGDCNNLTFGIGSSRAAVEEGAIKDTSGSSKGKRSGFGYYETIAGGSGAGPTWDGTDGVHTHMTNTRITDAEVFEKRYPVILRDFRLRHDSEGKGLHPGGKGVIRDIEFRIPVQVSILSERRVFRPYGLKGGGDGACGINFWVRQNRAQENEEFEKEGAIKPAAKWINLGGKNTATMQPGDRIVICTPGGGAWGATGGSRQVKPGQRDHQANWRKGSIAQRLSSQETT